MIRLIRTDSSNSDFKKLVEQLDAYLAKIDGDEHGFYAQFNTIDALKHVVIAYEKGLPVSCGAIKQAGSDNMEVKRMYTLPEHRGKGIATKVLFILEQWAKELSFAQCVLETGKRQPEAIRLYEKNGYKLIPNYGQYIGIENSVCFGKRL